MLPNGRRDPASDGTRDHMHAPVGLEAATGVGRSAGQFLGIAQRGATTGPLSIPARSRSQDAFPSRRRRRVRAGKHVDEDDEDENEDEDEDHEDDSDEAPSPRGLGVERRGSALEEEHLLLLDHGTPEKEFDSAGRGACSAEGDDGDDDDGQWLEVDVPERVLNLGSVVLRDVHVLRRFDVMNRSNRTLTVELGSSLPDEQLGFQLTNENLQIDNEEDHNQLFNTINRIHALTLSPRERQTIILSFLPELPPDVTTHPTPHEGDDDELAIRGDSRTSFTVKGEITITALPQKGRATAQKTVVALLARVCKLEMKVDATELVFDNCLVGGSYVKDFTVRNHSEIPLLFAVKVDSAHFGVSSKEKVLEFIDYDTGTPVREHLMPTFAHITIRVTYRPAEVGNFSYVVRIENIKDPNSVHFISIKSSVVSELRPKSIMLSAAKLNFGDCYTGLPVYQLLTVKNVTEDTMEVFFDSDASDEVTFDLITDSDQKSEQKPMISTGSYDSDSESESESESRPDQHQEYARKGDEEELSSSLEPEEPAGSRAAVKAARHSRIEEISLGPGAEKTIKLWYCPELGENIQPSDVVPGNTVIEKMATLSRRNFQIFLTCKNHEGQLHTRKTVVGEAKVCTSFIYAPRTEINLGDCDVGSWRSAVVELMNLSDLPAKVALKYQSKVVTFRQQHITIPPRQSADLKLDFVPRKINPDYRKEITFVNIKNKSNDQFVEVRANNIDPLRITFHSVFYHLITPHSHNYLDFENVIVGAPAVRTFLIRNVSGNNLRLELKTSLPDEITLCKQGESSVLSQSPQSKTEQLMQRIEDNEHRIQQISRNNEVAKYLDLANSRSEVSPAKRPHSKSFSSDKRSKELVSQGAFLLAENERSHQRRKLVESNDSVSTLTEELSASGSAPQTPLSTSPANDLTSLVRKLSYTGTLPDSMTKASEEQYIMSQEKRFKGVLRALNEGLLVPLTGKSLHLLPDEECVVYVVFRPSPTKRGWLQGKLKKMKASISIRLIDFDLATLHQESRTSENTIPPRDLLVTANICRSIMELAQRNINFGTVFKNTKQQQKTLIINNLSEIPLCYRVKKSGSIASLDLVISKADRLGIVQPYRRKELHFLFKPTITGPFNEKLVIENIHDSSNNQVVTVKALVKPNVTFFLRSLSMDFGITILGMKSKRCQIIISNTTKHRRQYEIKLDEELQNAGTCEYDVLLRLEKIAPIVLTKEEEVQVAYLLQRIKIARRKGQEEKIAKYMEQLNKLQAGKIQKESPGSSNVTSGYSSDVDEGDERKERSKRNDAAFAVQKNSLSLNIDGGGACSVLATLRPKALKRTPRESTKGVLLEGRLLIFETKNVDVVKSVSWRATICPSHEDYMKLALTETTKTSRSSDDVRDMLAAELSQVMGSSPLKEGVLTPPNSPIHSSFDKFLNARLEKERFIDHSSVRQLGELDEIQELEITPLAINLGAVRLGKSVSSQFTIRNPADEDITYAIFETDERQSAKRADTVVIVKEEGGVIKARGTKDVVFSILPQDTGRHTFYISVMNMKTMKHRTVSLTLTVEKSRGLRYPDLVVGEGHNYVIDLGLCYIDGGRSEYAKVHPFRIQNMSSTALMLATQSNMPSQVFLFQDSELTQPAVDILLPPRKICTIFICLQPNKRRLNQIYSDGNCRDIVGGIRIKAVEAESLGDISSESILNDEKKRIVPTYEETIKFTAVLGKSILSVSPHVIDLGYLTAQSNIPVKGYFELYNQSSRLPLEWFIPTPKLFKLNRLRGHLKPRTASLPADESCQRIEVSFIPRHFGYFEEEIKVYNTHSRDPALRVKINLFVREDVIHLGGGDIMCETTTSEPLVNFGFTYLRPRGLISASPRSPVDGHESETSSSTRERTISEDNGETEVEEDDPSNESGNEDFELELNTIASSEQKMKSIILQNVLDSDIIIRAKTNIDLPLTWLHDSLEVIQTSTDGNEYTLRTGQKATLLIGAPLPTPKTLQQQVGWSASPLRSQRLLNHLNSGHLIDILGNLLIERRIKSKVSGRERESLQCCQLVRIKATFAMAMARINPIELDLGTISDVWKAIPFEISLENLSSAPLECKVCKIPLEVKILSPPLQIEEVQNKDKSQRAYEVENPQTNAIIAVPPSGTVSLSAALNPSEVNYALQDHYQDSIVFENVNNSYAPPMAVHIRAAVSLYHLKYSGLSSEGDLILPTLVHPAPPNTPPVDEWFTVQNTSGRTLDIEIQGQLNLPMADLISMQILSRESNLPITKFTVRAGDSYEIKVRVEPRKDTRVPPHLGKKYKDYPLGKLYLRSEHVAETIQIHGSIEPGPAFALSTNHLHFRSAVGAGDQEHQTQMVRVKNLLPQFPVQVHFIEQLPGLNQTRGDTAPKEPESMLATSENTILDIQPDKAVIGPGESLDIAFTLREPIQQALIGSLSEERTVIATDLRAPSMPQTITVTHSRLEAHKAVSGRQGVVIDTSSLAVKREDVSLIANRPPAASHLVLRGCTPITTGRSGSEPEEMYNRYEINLGQHVHATGPVMWTITLEKSNANESNVPLEYKIYTLKDDDKTWMTIGRNRGILSRAGEHQQVTLTFATDKVDFYSTYLLIQNIDNPQDLKTIRISHEVVSQEKVLFGVLVDGKQVENPVIDLGDVYYDQVYRDHSFIILNQSDMALDFLLTDAATVNDRVEVGFSLSQTTLKIFNALNIEPRRSVRVFVHFQALSPEKNADYEIPMEKTININVSCRLVKDYQATIQLRARLRPSSLQFSVSNVAYRGSLHISPSIVSGQGSDSVTIDIADEAKDIVLTNIVDRPIKYRIMNDSLFFTTTNDQEEIETGKTATVTVRLNMAAISQNKRLFLKEKYIEEHITAYILNPQRYTEHSFITLRLMLGRLPSDIFYTSPGAKNAYPFVTLEERIVLFMRQLNSFFTGHTVGEKDIQTTEPESVQQLLNPLGMALTSISNYSEGKRQQFLEHFSFELHFLTDQLGLYGLKKQTGGNALRLAHLLFFGLQKQYDLSTLIHKWSKTTKPVGFVQAGSRVLIQMINIWAGRLSYFVGLFPEASGDLEILRALRVQLESQTNQLHAFLQDVADAPTLSRD